MPGPVMVDMWGEYGDDEPEPEAPPEGLFIVWERGSGHGEHSAATVARLEPGGGILVVAVQSWDPRPPLGTYLDLSRDDRDEREIERLREQYSVPEDRVFEVTHG